MQNDLNLRKINSTIKNNRMMSFDSARRGTSTGANVAMGIPTMLSTAEKKETSLSHLGSQSINEIYDLNGSNIKGNSNQR